MTTLIKRKDKERQEHGNAGLSVNTSRNRLINIPILDATGAPRFLGTVFAGRDHIRTLMANCHGNN